MKIGIISINAHTKVLNFASPLHTYAFQQFLLQNGIESTIIDYKPIYFGKFDVRHPLHYYQTHPNQDEAVQEELIAKWTALYDAREKRYDRFEEFIQKYYIKTDICYTAKSIEKTDPGFDCYICATDVIWKNNRKTGLDRGFFLAAETMKGKKKIAYAASRGSTGYKNEREEEFLRYISDFDTVSVREHGLQEYIQNITGIAVLQVLDPIFLQERTFYENLAIEPQEQEYILLYIVMGKADELVEKTNAFAKKKNLQVIILGEEPDDVQKLEVPCRFVYDIGVEEWLGYLKNASYIFTNSFHACCFSVIFQKQFFAGARGGDKIDTVLDLFRLSWRRIADDSNGRAEDMRDIDFHEADELRRRYVKESKDFILNAIRKAEKNEHTPLIPEVEGLIEELQLQRKRAEEEKRLKKLQEEKKKKSLVNRTKKKIKKILFEK